MHYSKIHNDNKYKIINITYIILVYPRNTSFRFTCNFKEHLKVSRKSKIIISRVATAVSPQIL